jgi:hypothetical protein
VSGGGSGDKDSGATVDGEVHDDAVGPGTDATGALYGGFPVDASFLDVDETPDADKHDTSFAPPYGIAPPEDAGAPSDANDDDADASLPDSGIAVPYGVPVGDP